MIEKRICLTCGEPVVGRSDKRYCDDGCRNAYNNKLNSVPNNFVRKIDAVLKRNRRVLGEVLGEEKKQKVSRESLLAKGLNFDFFTYQLSNTKGQVYFFVYEYGYLRLGDETFLVVHKNYQKVSSRK